MISRTEPQSKPALVDRRQVLEVEPPVQGGERAPGETLEDREVDHVGVEVQHVELFGARPDLGQLAQVRGEVGLERRRIEPDGLVAHGDQMGLGLRPGAGEQGHLVAELHQRVAQVRDDALGAAVQARRDGFIEGCDLGDPHDDSQAVQRAANARLALRCPDGKVEINVSIRTVG